MIQCTLGFQFNKLFFVAEDCCLDDREDNTSIFNHNWKGLYGRISWNTFFSTNSESNLNC